MFKILTFLENGTSYPSLIKMYFNFFLKIYSLHCWLLSFILEIHYYVAFFFFIGTQDTKFYFKSARFKKNMFEIVFSWVLRQMQNKILYPLKKTKHLSQNIRLLIFCTLNWVDKVEQKQKLCVFLNRMSCSFQNLTQNLTKPSRKKQRHNLPPPRNAYVFIKKIRNGLDNILFIIKN